MGAKEKSPGTAGLSPAPFERKMHMLWFYRAYCNHSNWCRILFINSISRGKGARGSCFDVSFVGLQVETWRITCFSGSKVSQFILSISLVTSSMNSRLFPFFLFHLLISRVYIYIYIMYITVLWKLMKSWNRNLAWAHSLRAFIHESFEASQLHPEYHGTKALPKSAWVASCLASFWWS